MRRIRGLLEISTMLTTQSQFHTVPHGRLRQRDRGRAHDKNTTAPRLLTARRPAPAAAAGRRRAGHPLLAASSSGSAPHQPGGSCGGGPLDDGGSSMSSAPLLAGAAKGEGGGGGEPAAPAPSSWLGRVVDVEEARAQLRFAVPMVLTSMAYYGIPLVSVMFSGHLGDVHLAGATLGNSWATVTGYAFVTGLSGALETLCGQAYGARLYRMLGLYLQSSLIMSAVISVLVSALWWFTEPVLVFLRQDPEVSRAAASFVRCQIPGLFAFSFLQCLLRYLQTQSIVVPLVVCSVLPFALHVALAHLLVNVLGLGLAGASAAASATFWISCLMLLAYVIRSEAFSETWKGFSAEAFKYVLPTMKLATPSAVMVCLEYWAFELLVLIAGLLPNSTVSTSLIAMCSSTEAIAYMITFGFSAAVSTRVSNEIGAGNVDRAKTAVSTTLKLSVFLALTFVALLASGHTQWARLFSGSAAIVSEFAAIAPLVTVSIVLDSAQGVLSGVARGCGWQHLAAVTNLVAFYFVGMPLAILFAFKLDLRARGLWAGLICGLVCQAFALLVITARTKWSQLADAMREEKANYVA
ncbi:Protein DETOXIFICATION 19 [Dichanthelium oligosanthes]|uniref:Protein DETOXIFICATION n=1 Tax=Dichanthelium oligosanthes TaxID=888268 RepID=A0A1E5VYZ6_9POAL|nr:Protein DETOXIFICATION 19 [Dichanthelium oligosanthes]